MSAPSISFLLRPSTTCTAMGFAFCSRTSAGRPGLTPSTSPTQCPAPRTGCFDLLASEARLGSVAGIALGLLTAEHVAAVRANMAHQSGTSLPAPISTLAGRSGAARCVIEKVRAQFREKPGIFQGTEAPDYARCVDIVTKRALREMVSPGLLGVLAPVAVGTGFRVLGDRLGVTGAGATAVGAILLVATMTGILLAKFMNNVGGAWDDAKKLVESGQFGGERSDAHKAIVVGDTAGDPLKDTAGPSLYVLIKLISTVSLVLAPLFI